ncbi:hypothetical protein ENKNEFLB_02684 [Nocardioides aquaticus]|uniref:Tetratricopeptide repeat protein n=1 Tax=Nocardioides aquaticus TaxID=160826 RepID=A0ABX8EIF1_9ACTN|nr:tetratricopeptide repeat protein [Nocardioides aquaticus]QVT80292.1 hypothetical protein ENKNEFLB_02684 [Nocardioides aquaticus]
MVEQRRGPRSGSTNSGARSGRGPEDRRGRPADDRRGRPSDDRRGGGQRPTGNRDKRSDDRKGPEEKPARIRRTPEDQAIYDGPDLPDSVTGKELDRSVTGQLKGLPEKLAARVARHLAAAGMVIDDDPELAYRHALAARARAPRIAVVREAAGEAAYAAGHYAEALSDLRAAKRLNGATAYLPIMADCHRALGQPEQALKLSKSPGVANFAPEARAEMTIVEAGARRDMGQLDAALRVLEQAPINSQNRSAWVVRLRYAYADTLVTAGQQREALEWFHRTHAIDADQLTDAEARAAELERRRDDETGRPPVATED